MIEYFNSLEMWQKILVCVLAFLLVFSLFIYIREVIIYNKRKKVRVMPLTLEKITEDNYLVVRTKSKVNRQKTHSIYLNGYRCKFKFDMNDKKLVYIKTSDIFQNEFYVEFCSEPGLTFVRGEINIDDDFPRPYAKNPVVEEAPVVEEVKEQPVEEVKEQPVEEVKEEPVVEETPVVEAPVTEETDGDSDESEVIIENGVQIVITYNYSFDARLIQSNDETRNWYNRLINELDSYADLKYKQSWKKIRVYKGRKTLAIIRFRGKKLCIAYALDPKKYEETKYRGVDLSDKKSYQDTPMMLKTTSERRFNYQLHLLGDVCKENEIAQGEVSHKTIKIPAYMNRDKLISKELVKVKRKEIQL